MDVTLVDHECAMLVPAKKYLLCAAMGIGSFFYNDTASTEIYTLSLHDALPIWFGLHSLATDHGGNEVERLRRRSSHRSEEHTSELQSRLHLVCRLLLEKKNTHLHSSRRPAPTRRAR